jgi:L-aspartate oxidase
VVRHGDGLSRLLGRLTSHSEAALPVIAARLVVEAALARRESRGGHFRADFPGAAARPEHTTATLPLQQAGRRAAA